MGPKSPILRRLPPRGTPVVASGMLVIVGSRWVHVPPRWGLAVDREGHGQGTLVIGHGQVMAEQESPPSVAPLLSRRGASV